MKKIILLLSIFTFFMADSSAQFEEQSLKFGNLKLSNQSEPKYFDVNHRFIFEYGLLFCIGREGVASSFSASYDLNLISKKLYGSIQLGFAVFHGEDKSNAGGLVGFGIDYSVYTENKYNFSIYTGLQGIMFSAVFGVAHFRNSIMISNKAAFTFGLRYLKQIDAKEHWLMPTFGFQLFLK